MPPSPIKYIFAGKSNQIFVQRFVNQNQLKVVEVYAKQYAAQVLKEGGA